MTRVSARWWLPLRVEYVASVSHARWLTANRKTKRIFDGDQASNVVEFGGSRDTDRPRGIIKGKLSLTRQEVEAPFEDVIKRIVESCLELLNGRKVQVCPMFSSRYTGIFTLHD
jgi:molecular chaperone DnaK (HSP70)